MSTKATIHLTAETLPPRGGSRRQASVQRAIVGAWLLLAATSVSVCWYLGLLDVSRAQGGGEGWGGLFAIATTAPTVGGLLWARRLLRHPRPWLPFGLTLSGLVATSVLSTAAAGFLIDHERSLQRHAGKWWARDPSPDGP